MEFHIDKNSVHVYGLDSALIHSSNAFNSNLIREDSLSANDKMRGEKLGRTPTGQSLALSG